MTIAEAQRFYEGDLKKYDISKNQELLTWLNESINNGYYPYTDTECLQELIDNIVSWYEIKYPEREMKFYEGIRYYDFENMKTLSKVMNISQLMYRLPDKQLSLMKCNYRSNGGGVRYLYDDNGKKIGEKPIIFMGIKSKKPEITPFSIDLELPKFLLFADIDSGKVNIDYSIKKYITTDNITLEEINITLEELLVLFKEKYSDELDFTKLQECIYNHNCDLELRRRILQLVALKLLYSHKTIPERGYERAKRFINEFNKKMNLALSTEEIDELINRDYTTDKTCENTLKDYIEETESHLSKKEDIKKEEKALRKAKKLIKSLLKK